jgi:hypothetical protein
VRSRELSGRPKKKKSISGQNQQINKDIRARESGLFFNKMFQFCDIENWQFFKEKVSQIY